ncbi:MAG: xanthine dehydrogenase family protein subunit M [Anaerolineae bacterium]|nr:xanthine dehydrogenase family protein subunit M [Anaerolineae bacterium]
MPEFDLIVAKDFKDLLGLVHENPQARLLAGATDLIPLMGAGKWKSDLVIDISRLNELRGIQLLEQGISIKPLTTHAEAAASELIIKHAGALSEACLSIADPLIRRRATLGGNICTASPAADSVPALMALGAEIKLQHLNGERMIPLEKFLLGPGKTSIQPGEVLTEIKIPMLPNINRASAFLKLGRRKAMAISVVNAAVLIHHLHQKISFVRLSLGSVAPTVMRSSTAEAFLLGKDIPDLINQSRLVADNELWLNAVNQDISPIGDVRASGDYRRFVAVTLAQKAVLKACERALEKPL